MLLLSMMTLSLMLASVQARQQAPTTIVQYEGGELRVGQIADRLRTTGVVLRLGVPTPNSTICQVKETLRDMLAERGFAQPDVDHEFREDARRPGEMLLTFRITPGERSRDRVEKSPLTVARRCAR